MKHLFLFVLALCLNQLSYSQNEYNSAFDQDYLNMRFSQSNVIPSKNVNKVILEVITSKNNRVEKYVRCFDKEENLTCFVHLNNRKDTVEKGVFSYVGKNKLKQCEVYKKGVLKRTSIFTYDNKNHLISFLQKDGKNRMKSLAQWKINDKEKITESVLYKEDTSKLKYRWVYDFHEDGAQAKSILYNGKGKVKRTWSYVCNPEGGKVDVKEKEVQICKNSHSDEQFYITTRRSVNEKGKVYKTVQKFTITDQLPIESCTYNEKDSLIYKSVYDKSYDRPISYTGFNIKGKKTYEYVYTYENGKKTSYCFSNRGKLKYKTILKYNTEGLLVEEKHYDSKGEIISITKLSYEM